MGLSGVFVISFILGIDAFSLSIGIGLCGIQRKKMYLISSLIAVFHILMPLFGLYIGQSIGLFIGPIAGKVGALVLILIGGYYLYEHFTKSEIECDGFDCSVLGRPLGLLLLAGSVSLDAFAVGFGLGVIGANLLITVLIMGFVAGSMTFSGLVLGKSVNSSVGRKAELLGGLMLIVIGIIFYLR